MKLDILAIGAHPDDVELGCGATLAKEIAMGKKVGILDLTQGEMGTRGTPGIRKIEATNAAHVLGVQFRENLYLPDGFVENTKSYQMALLKVIRTYKPDIVLTNAIDDRHPDHSRASQLTETACFLSGLRKIETTVDNKKQEAWRPKHIYHYIQWKNLIPDFVVDVSGFLDQKMKSVLAYKSQFYDKTNEEPNTPISTQNFVESIQSRARDLGRLIGTAAGEGFMTSQYVAVKKLDDLL